MAGAHPGIETGDMKDKRRQRGWQAVSAIRHVNADRLTLDPLQVNPQQLRHLSRGSGAFDEDAVRKLGHSEPRVAKPAAHLAVGLRRGPEAAAKLLRREEMLIVGRAGILLGS